MKPRMKTKTAARPGANRRRYLEILARLTPAARLRKALELGRLSRTLFLEGLRRRFPDLDERQLRILYLERLAKCHNRIS